MNSSGGSVAAGSSSPDVLAEQQRSHEPSELPQSPSSSTLVRIAPKTTFKSVNVSEHSKLFVIETQPHVWFRNMSLFALGAAAAVGVGLVSETQPKRRPFPAQAAVQALDMHYTHLSSWHVFVSALVASISWVLHISQLTEGTLTLRLSHEHISPIATFCRVCAGHTRNGTAVKVSLGWREASDPLC